MTRRLEMEKVEPHLFVVFGATGDLSRRKLLPAFHRLMKDRLGESVVLGVAGSVLTDEEFRARSLKALVEAGVGDEDAQRWCGRALHYQPIGEGFDALVERIEKIERDESLPGNRVFYLALPPEAFDETVTRLGESGLSRAPGWVRIVVEKPFGEDLASSQKATASLARWFSEAEIFRIDHYLGKETVQNLLVFRFANLLFESSWHRDRIAAVQVTVAEDGGVGTRGRYYDKSGAVRDIMQNHLTQLLALIAMEPPVRLGADEIRDEKVKLLRAIWPVDPDSAVLGQYGPGEVGGVPVLGYGEEVGNPESRTPTFVAVAFTIDTWRWQGVPFYLRTGKRLPRRVTEIDVIFRPPPVCLFDESGACQVHGNVLRITLQPDEGFELRFDVKRPGDEMVLETHGLRFGYEEAFGPMPEAYETLLYDVVVGEQTLFVRTDEVEEAWRIWAPLLSGDLEVHPYPAGSFGPQQAGSLPHRRGHHWQLR